MSEVVYSLVLRGSDGLQYYASFKDNLDWIHQKMGICVLKQRLTDLEEKNRKLEARLQALEQPARMKRILALLRTQDQGRTQRWLRYRLPDLCYEDLAQLKADCRIHSFVKGKVHLYIVKEL
jgi:hypothetical protein